MYPQSALPTPASLPGNAEALPVHEKSQLRAAARHARLALPGPIGELVSREITAYAEFGYRFGTDALVPRLAVQVLAMPTAAGQGRAAA
jgi:hypothetical protein